MAPASAGSTCAAESPALTCCGVAPSARASAEERLASSAVAQVMKIALTAARATSVIVSVSSTWFSRSVRAGLEPLDGEVGVGGQRGDDPADRDRDADDGEDGAARAPRGHAQSEQQRDGQPRRERDQPGRAPRRAGRVGEREDGAGAGGADGGDEGRRDRHRERDGRHEPTVDSVGRARARAAEEAGAGLGEQWSGQPSEREPGRRREQGDDDVLGEQHGGDQARRAADRLEQSDAADLVGHPAADEDRDAGHGEQGEQPGAGDQRSPLVLDEVGARLADVLPGLQERGRRDGSRSRPAVGWAGCARAANAGAVAGSASFRFSTYARPCPAGARPAASAG